MCFRLFTLVNISYLFAAFAYLIYIMFCLAVLHTCHTTARKTDMPGCLKIVGGPRRYTAP